MVPGRAWCRCGRTRVAYVASRMFTTSLMSVDLFTFLELIVRTAIGADCATRLHDLDVDAGVHAPERSLGAGAIDGQVIGPDVDGLALLGQPGLRRDVLGRTAHFVS